ncbi:MAG TPA: hypothetical protein ENN67_07030 [Firmicutes bacterium]|nr:hypothetical protein [Bacillota bacterium]
MDEYKLAGLLGMTVTDGAHLHGPMLRGHWRGFTVEITVAPPIKEERSEFVPLFPQPPEFLITFHLGKSSDVEIGIRHRALEATGVKRPPMIGKKKCHLPPEFAREYIVRGPSAKAVKEIVDSEMLALITRLANFGPPDLAIEYSLMRYRGIGDYVERYRDLPGILGALVEIGRHIDSKFTIGLGDIARKRPMGTEEGRG